MTAAVLLVWPLICCVYHSRNMAGKKERRVFLCDVKAHGLLCGHQSRDAYNHKRHLALKHGIQVSKDSAARQTTGFVHMTPSDFDGSKTAVPDGDDASTSVASSADDNTGSMDESVEVLDQAPPADEYDPEESEPEEPELGRVSPQTGPRWLGTQSTRDAAPCYEVKRSRVMPQQQCAISWMTEDGVRGFLYYLQKLLGSWGVDDLTYKQTCVLVPADWMPLRPQEIMRRFSLRRCPDRHAQRPVILPSQRSWDSRC
jgi:hypothetical protein